MKIEINSAHDIEKAVDTVGYGAVNAKCIMLVHGGRHIGVVTFICCIRDMTWTVVLTPFDGCVDQMNYVASKLHENVRNKIVYDKGDL